VDHARVEAQNHRFTYDEQITVESVTQAVSDLSLKFGEDSSGKVKSLNTNKIIFVVDFFFTNQGQGAADESSFWCCSFACGH
jgi:20S proteasome alpha/beta subunit